MKNSIIKSNLKIKSNVKKYYLFRINFSNILKLRQEFLKF